MYLYICICLSVCLHYLQPPTGKYLEELSSPPIRYPRPNILRIERRAFQCRQRRRRTARTVERKPPRPHRLSSLSRTPSTSTSTISISISELPSFLEEVHDPERRAPRDQLHGRLGVQALRARALRQAREPLGVRNERDAVQRVRGRGEERGPRDRVRVCEVQDRAARGGIAHFADGARGDVDRDPADILMRSKNKIKCNNVGSGE